MNNWKINSEFIDSIKEISYKMQDKYNIPALLLMSIAALETGWGKEKQSVDHNIFSMQNGINKRNLRNIFIKLLNLIKIKILLKCMILLLILIVLKKVLNIFVTE